MTLLPDSRETTTGQARRPKASDLLAQDLRRQIMSRRLLPGDPLPSEAGLMVEHRLSRGSVREALRLVEAEGLITIRRGARGGVVVAHPNLTQVTRSMAALLTVSDAPLWQLSELQQLLEPRAAALAARHATAPQREELLRVAETTGDPMDEAVDFHYLVSVATNQELYRVVLSALHRLSMWHGGDDFSSEQDMGAMRRAHIAVAQAIAVGDEQGAHVAMQRHIDAIERLMAKQGLDRPIVPRSTWRDDTERRHVGNRSALS